MKYLSICITAIILVSCGSAQNKNQAQESDEARSSVRLEMLWETDRILLATSSGSTFKSIDWGTFEVTVLAEEIGHGDGIASAGNGNYIISDWRGRIFYVPAKGETITLLDTREQEINAADIDYVIETNTLYVPTFNKNTLKAYKVIIE